MSEVINKISRFLVRLKRCFVKFNESSLVWGPQSEVSRRRVYEFPKETAQIQEGKSCKDHNFVLVLRQILEQSSEWTVYCMLYLSTLRKLSGIPMEDHQDLPPKLVHISSPSGVTPSNARKYILTSSLGPLQWISHWIKNISCFLRSSHNRNQDKFTVEDMKWPD